VKFVEEVFGLPSLGQRDMLANDTTDSFDFTQSPRSPLILTPRLCPLISVQDYYLGWEPIGGTNSGRSVTITNDQTSTINLNSISVSAGFGVTENTCGTSLAVGKSCTFDVVFKPQAAGLTTGTLTVVDTGITSPEMANLSGTGSSLAPSPSTLTFSTTLIGSTAPAKTILLKNLGSSAVAISDIFAVGEFAATNTCHASLKAGSSCSIHVTYSPTTSGTQEGGVNIISSDPASPQTLLVKGTSTAVHLSQTALNFGSQKVGTTSAPLSFSLSNTSAVPLNIGAISASGDFAQTNTCVSPLAGGANCTITITFTPTATGARVGTFSIADSDFQSPQSVSLAGTGD